MSKKIGLHIGGRRFDVDVEENFAAFLSAQMTKDFNIDGNNDLKLLLQAYVRKNHELFLQEKKHQDLLEKIEKEL
ncbi:MAG: hypothetical protein WBK95_00605 [Sulfurimonas sp.]|nr:hypothetical protein [Sulfurimonas sp.]MDD3060502.1 hypothetical protein [Sulfurimonas sp.]